MKQFFAPEVEVLKFQFESILTDTSFGGEIDEGVLGDNETEIG